MCRRRRCPRDAAVHRRLGIRAPSAQHRQRLRPRDDAAGCPPRCLQRHGRMDGRAHRLELGRPRGARHRALARLPQPPGYRAPDGNRLNDVRRGVRRGNAHEGVRI